MIGRFHRDVIKKGRHPESIYLTTESEVCCELFRYYQIVVRGPAIRLDTPRVKVVLLLWKLAAGFSRRHTNQFHQIVILKNMSCKVCIKVMSAIQVQI